jgi:arylsulfatase A-like enzyme
MNRRQFLASAAVPAFLRPPPRNVLLIVDENFRPPKDLVAKGVFFPDTFATTLSFDASLSVLHSGLHTHANGHLGESRFYRHFGYHDFVRPLSSVLKDAGYSTVSVGRMHVHPQRQFRWDARLAGNPWFLNVVSSDSSEALQVASQSEQTLIVYAGVPNRRDATMRAPLLVWSPELSNGGSINRAMVSWVDLMPTVLGWCGVKPPPYPLHGRSLLGVLNNKNPEQWNAVYFSHTFDDIASYSPFRGIRSGSFKYVHRLSSDAEELCDGSDTRNLAGSPLHQETLAELRAATRQFRERTQDPWLTQ